MSKHIHPVIAQLRPLRHAAGLSLQQMQDKHGIIAVVLGSYERGDRQPTVDRIQTVLDVYGYDLAIVPKAGVTDDPALPPRTRTTAELVAELRAIADQLARAGA